MIRWLKKPQKTVKANDTNIEKIAAATGKSTLEIWKEIAKQRGVADDVIKTWTKAQDAIDGINEKTGDYIITLTDE